MTLLEAVEIERSPIGARRRLLETENGARQGSELDQSGRPVAYLNSWYAHIDPSTTGTSQVAYVIRRTRHAKSRNTARSTARIPAGLRASDDARCPWTTAVTLRVMPQNGQGTPVSVRRGQGGPSPGGSTEPRRAAMPSIAAPAARSRPASTVCTDRSGRGAAVHGCGPPTASGASTVATSGAYRPVSVGGSLAHSVSIGTQVAALRAENTEVRWSTSSEGNDGPNLCTGPAAGPALGGPRRRRGAHVGPAPGHRGARRRPHRLARPRRGARLRGGRPARRPVGCTRAPGRVGDRLDARDPRRPARRSVPGPARGPGLARHGDRLERRARSGLGDDARVARPRRHRAS